MQTPEKTRDFMRPRVSGRGRILQATEAVRLNAFHGGRTDPQREDPAEQDQGEGPLPGLLRRLRHRQRQGGPEASVVRHGLGARGGDVARRPKTPTANSAIGKSHRNSR